MLARKVSKYSWRACQPYETCYNYNKATVKKQFSFWKVAISVLAAFFVVVFLAKVLNSVGQKMEGPVETKADASQEIKSTKENTKVSLINKLLGIKTAQAADFSAQKMPSSCDNLTISANETKTCVLGFLNLGSLIWSNTGQGFVSIYTAKPNYRTSIFYDTSWYHQDQPSLIKGVTGKNQLGLLELKIKAPAQAGQYYESFRLASEDKAWIPGGEFTLTIKVVSSGQFAVVQPTTSASQTTTTSVEETAAVSSGNNISLNDNTAFNSATPNGIETLGAMKLLQSTTSLEFKGTDRQLVRIGFKNTGLVSWKSYGNEPVVLAPKDTVSQSFSDVSWLTDDQIVFLKGQETEVGQIGYFEFYLSPSAMAGSYTASFQLKTGSRVIPGSEFSLPIIVNANAVLTQKQNSSSGSTGAIFLAQAPTVRVGLTKVKIPVWLSVDYSSEVWSGQTKIITSLAANDPVTIDYVNGQYTITTNRETFTSLEPVRVIPLNGVNGIVTIKNYENRPSWNQTLNDNQFRGTLEVNGPDSTGRVWAINVLDIESYAKGSGEVSNISPLEYLKAMAVAYRSYAYYHFQRDTGRFTVFDSSSSQVYLGYGAEKRLPNLSQAVDMTRGQLVTYNDVPVVTPYFSQSDGRTRSWTEAWGGEAKPWLVSVSVPQDIGNTLWGHGVGMSCRAAINMANANMGYLQILQSFYTGTNIRQQW